MAGARYTPGLRKIPLLVMGPVALNRKIRDAADGCGMQDRHMKESEHLKLIEHVSRSIESREALPALLNLRALLA